MPGEMSQAVEEKCRFPVGENITYRHMHVPLHISYNTNTSSKKNGSSKVRTLSQVVLRNSSNHHQIISRPDILHLESSLGPVEIRTARHTGLAPSPLIPHFPSFFFFPTFSFYFHPCTLSCSACGELVGSNSASFL